jgi:hypothetical protein
LLVRYEIREDDASRRFLAASEARAALRWWPWTAGVSVLVLAGMFLVGPLKADTDSVRFVLPFAILMFLTAPMLAVFYWITHRLFPGSRWCLDAESVVLRGRNHTSIPYGNVDEHSIHPIDWPPGYRQYLLTRYGGDIYQIIVRSGPDLDRFDEELARRISAS